MASWFFAFQPALVGLVMQSWAGMLVSPPADAWVRMLSWPAQSRGAAASPMVFSSAGHVLNFGPGRVVIGNPADALVITLAGAGKAEPVFSNGRNSSLHRNLPEFHGQVSYANPWPGVTVIYYAHPGALFKSEYRLRAGFTQTTLERIRIRYNRPVALDGKGGLEIPCGRGKFREAPLIAWQEIGGRRIPVEASLVQRGSREIGFSAKGYDRKYELILDPSLTWMTFLDVLVNEKAYAVKLDGAGNIFVAGSDAYDVTVYKLNSSGEKQWHVVLGGGGTDKVGDLALDADGNIYLVGDSTITWASPLHAHTGTGSSDVYVAKLGSDGGLLWNTFYGCGGSDTGAGLALDAGGNIYITGLSNATWGTPLRTGLTPYGYLAKLTNNGNLLWNTFLQADLAAVTVDNLGNAAVAGDQYASYQWGTPVQPNNGAYDGFVVKVDPDGTILWSTCMGSSSYEYASCIRADSSGNFYVGGYGNYSWGVPIRQHSNTGYDAFLTKLDSNGNWKWNTFLGGAGNDYGYGLDLDGDGNLFVTGESSGSWGTPWRAYSSGVDAFVARVDNGGHLIWNAFFGESGTDAGRGVVANSLGGCVLAGDSNAGWGTPLNVFKSGFDPFVVKIFDVAPTPTPTSEANLPAVSSGGVGVALLHSVAHPGQNGGIQLYARVLTPQKICVEAFDVRGQRCAVIANQTYSAGNYTLTWDTLGASSGMYVIRAKWEGGEFQGKAVVVK